MFPLGRNSLSVFLHDSKLHVVLTSIPLVEKLERRSDIYLLLSWDSSLEGTLGGKRAGGRLSSKKSSLDDAQLEIHELNQSLNSNTFLR